MSAHDNVNKVQFASLIAPSKVGKPYPPVVGSKDIGDSKKATANAFAAMFGSSKVGKHK